MERLLSLKGISVRSLSSFNAQMMTIALPS
jgi:hypothetical protein